jgi:hypothetical protein
MNGRSRSASRWVSLLQCEIAAESGGRRVGGIFDRLGWNLSHLSDPLGGSLLGFAQLLHGHRLVEMVFGLSDLFTGDQELHIGVHQVLRSRATSRVKLCQGDLPGGQALLGSFFTDGQGRLIVASAIARAREQRCGQRLCGSGVAQRHEEQFHTAGDA